MTSRNRRNLAAAIVLMTALFADRALLQAAPVAAGAQAGRPMVADVAGRLMARLATRLQKVVPAVRLTAERRHGVTRIPVARASAPADAPVEPTLLFTLLHLPPPTVA
ncbi:MAG TPA: hypothetical protein VK324_11625 [Tepidisphaeraceae bacterium]|nr:hypothetical protein [Tepidisphaeraceae bacterium]